MSAERTEELDRHRFTRAGAWLLLFVGVIGMGLGAWYMRSQIVGAFRTDASPFKTSAEMEAERVAGLKTKDTDKDTISDYDETFVFKTSPYLEDSDSDGVNDQQELAAGKNPNCPEGKECGVLGGPAPTAAATEEPDPNSAEAKFIEQLANPTPEQVRQFLKDAGVKEEDMKDIGDATLMEMYRASLLEAQANQSKSP